MDKNKLLILNTIVQSIDDIQERIKYLEDLGLIYINLAKSDSFFIDKRDYNIYSVIKIGNQSWLGENLRYKEVESHLNPENSNINYGRLYHWEEAMRSCPKGWHIPTEIEWQTLESYMGMPQEEINKRGFERKNNLADILKSKFGWLKNRNGIDLYGFSALPTGEYDFHYSLFKNLGESTHFWSSTKSIDDEIFIRGIYLDSNHFEKGTYPPSWDYTFSCRCIKNF